jgi:hypothetical protein
MMWEARTTAAKSQGPNSGAQQFAAATTLNFSEYRRPLALALPFAPEGLRHVPIGSSRSILTQLPSRAKGFGSGAVPACLPGAFQSLFRRQISMSKIIVFLNHFNVVPRGGIEPPTP